MIDRKFIGVRKPLRKIEVEKYPLRLFSKAIGEISPIYSNEEAARSAGFRSIVVPPTYLFCLETMAEAIGPDVDLGIDYSKILHGEQFFTYHNIACAGDALVFDAHIADIYDKKGGALEFIVTDTAVTDSAGGKVADLRFVLAVKGGEG